MQCYEFNYFFHCLHSNNTCFKVSNVYAKRFEVVFLCSHPKIIHAASVNKYYDKSRQFVQKWVTRAVDNSFFEFYPTFTF